jgi:hypothetical protein
MKRVETFEEEEMQMDEEQWEKPELDAYPPSDLQQIILSHKDPESVLTARSLVSCVFYLLYNSFYHPHFFDYNKILYFLYDMLDFMGSPDTELADSFAATAMLTVAHRKVS